MKLRRKFRIAKSSWKRRCFMMININERRKNKIEKRNNRSSSKHSMI